VVKVLQREPTSVPVWISAASLHIHQRVYYTPSFSYSYSLYCVLDRSPPTCSDGLHVRVRTNKLCVCARALVHFLRTQKGSMLECALITICVCVRALVRFLRVQTGSMFECAQKKYVCVRARLCTSCVLRLAACSSAHKRIICGARARALPACSDGQHARVCAKNKKSVCVCARSCASCVLSRAACSSARRKNYVCVPVHAGERRRTVIRVRRSTLAPLEQAAQVVYGEGKTRIAQGDQPVTGDSGATPPQEGAWDRGKRAPATPAESGEGAVTPVVSGEVGAKGATQGAAPLVGAPLEGPTQGGKSAAPCEGRAAKCAAENPVVYGEGLPQEGAPQGGKSAAPCEGGASDSGVSASQMEGATQGGLPLVGATQGGLPLVGAPQEGPTQGGKIAAPCEGGASDSGVSASQMEGATQGGLPLVGATQGGLPLVGAPQEGPTQGGKSAASCEGGARDSGVSASQVVTARDSSVRTPQEGAPQEGPTQGDEQVHVERTAVTASESGVSTPQDGDEQVAAEGKVHAGVDGTVPAAMRWNYGVGAPQEGVAMAARRERPLEQRQTLQRTRCRRSDAHANPQVSRPPTLVPFPAAFHRLLWLVQT